MHLSDRSKSNFESLHCCAFSAASDAEPALESEDRHHIRRWPITSGFRAHALRLHKARELRLCNWCLRKRRRCWDSRRRHHNLQKSWKAFRRYQWVVEQ